MEENDQTYLKISRLIGLAIKNELNPEEEADLAQWLSADPSNKQLYDELYDESRRHYELQQINKYDDKVALDNFFKELNQENSIHYPIRRIWPRIAAAASILLFLSAGGYILFHREHPIQQIVQNEHNDLVPGSNKAVITLSNGKKINLNDAAKGVIAKEKDATIRKASDGTISYEDNSAAPAKDEVIAFNTITTPRGGQWPAVLPDGTQVMLDAASSIRYPVKFTGNERQVSITGQVWFKVKHDEQHPFFVTTKGQKIQDIGTEFNVNAYDDELAIKTTLIEGSINVSSGNEAKIIKPGQQAITKANNNTIVIKAVNIDDAIAWKNGLFQFTHSDIKEVMRQASRWYDVQIDYEGTLPPVTFTGNLPRNVNASRLLEALSLTGVHFKIDKKNIIVKP